MRRSIFYALLASIPIGLGLSLQRHLGVPGGMGSSALQLAKKMGRGWNLGNTMEAIGNYGENSWGNPKVTKDLIRAVKKAGFQSVRIPCAWDQYVENRATNKIKKSWLNRVKEVVQYCVDNGLYAVLNIHWDGGWLEQHCTSDMQRQVNAKQKSFWTQIATHLRDFDEHLLFASANEPAVNDENQMGVLMSYHQTFVDTVRATGGRNSYRVLVVQGPKTDVDTTNKLMRGLPRDRVRGRIMVEIHYYSPYQFTIMDKDQSWGKLSYYWGKVYRSNSDPSRNSKFGEGDVDNDMRKLKGQFIGKGIPVIMGEYCAARRLKLSGNDLKLHLESRKYWLRYVTRAALSNGIVPMYWDNGVTGDTGSGIFDRATSRVVDQKALQGIMQ